MFVVVVAIIISPWVASNQTLREGKLNTRLENNENVPHFVLENRKGHIMRERESEDVVIGYLDSSNAKH